MGERKQGDSISLAPMPNANKYDENLLNEIDYAKEVVTGIRNIRQEKNIPNKNTLSLFVKGDKIGENVENLIVKMAGLDSISYITDKVENAGTFLVKTTEFFIPLEGLVDVDEEIAKLKEELEYTKGFLNSVMKKLSNERFVNNAPASVVETERKKQADAEEKIKVIEQRLASMS